MRDGGTIIMMGGGTTWGGGRAMSTHSWGPFSSTPPSRRAVPNGRLCTVHKSATSHQVAVTAHYTTRGVHRTTYPALDVRMHAVQLQST